VTRPSYRWQHGGPLAGSGCVGTGSAAAGVAFSDPTGNYPASYDNGLFFADYTRGCIGVIPAGSGGLPDPAQAQVFATDTFGVVELEIGPDKNLWWVDLGGYVHRVTYSGGNQAPVARISANPTSCPVPLAFSFDGRGPATPTGRHDRLLLLGPGRRRRLRRRHHRHGHPHLHDARQLHRQTAGDRQPGAGQRSRLGDDHGGQRTPTAVIDTPAPTRTWTAGDTIGFSGHASDPQDGTLPATRLSWSLILHHCATPTDCHTTRFRTSTAWPAARSRPPTTSTRPGSSCG
jgi:hypothetical protein